MIEMKRLMLRHQVIGLKTNVARRMEAASENIVNKV